jgi:hypothetical protein
MVEARGEAWERRAACFVPGGATISMLFELRTLALLSAGPPLFYVAQRLATTYSVGSRILW